MFISTPELFLNPADGSRMIESPTDSRQRRQSALVFPVVQRKSQPIARSPDGAIVAPLPVDEASGCSLAGETGGPFWSPFFWSVYLQPSTNRRSEALHSPRARSSLTS